MCESVIPSYATLPGWPTDDRSAVETDMGISGTAADDTPPCPQHVATPGRSRACAVHAVLNHKNVLICSQGGSVREPRQTRIRGSGFTAGYASTASAAYRALPAGMPFAALDLPRPSRKVRIASLPASSKPPGRMVTSARRSSPVSLGTGQPDAAFRAASARRPATASRLVPDRW